MKGAGRAVGFVAPSGFVRDRELIDGAMRFFAGRGWRVRAGESCFARDTRFGGSDDLRAAELQGFACDPGLDLLLAARGGYGLTRLLDRFDYARIREAGRVLCGYSDFTAFSLAYLAQAGGSSLHGPSAIAFGAAAPEPFTVDNFFAVLGQDSHELRFDCDGPVVDEQGRLWGGNLAMLCSLLGTPYLPKLRGGILFVEDVNEPAYKIERMLLQLVHAGVLQRCRALLLGAFHPLPPQPNDNGYGLADAIARVREATATPIVTGLPLGHIARSATLPIGARAHLVARGSWAQLSFRDCPNLAGV